MTKGIFLWMSFLFWATAATPVQSQPGRTAYVVNGLAETLGKINLENGAVVESIATLGVVPNQIVLRGRRGYVVNSISSNVQIINLATGVTEGTVELGPSRNPWNLALADTETAYVTNFAAGTLSRINVVTRQVLGEFPVGLSPEGLAVVDGLVLVCNTGFNPVDFSYGQGTVAVFDPAVDSVVKVIPVGSNPQAIAQAPSGVLHVVCTGNYVNISGKIYEIDPATLTVVDSILIGGQPGAIGIGPNGIAYVAAGGFVGSGIVFSYDTFTGTVLHGRGNPIATGTGASAVAVDNLNQALVCDFQAATVTQLDSLGNPLATYALGDGPLSVAIYDTTRLGDLDGDGLVDLADIVTAVQHVVFDRRPLVIRLADVNADCVVDLLDIIVLVRHIVFGTPQLLPGCA